MSAKARRAGESSLKILLMQKEWMPTEHEEQVAVIDWANKICGQRRELNLLYAVPNGGQRNKAVAGKLKAEGVKSGVSDLVLPVARGRYHGLYLEMKAKNGNLTTNQAWWLTELSRQGYCALWARGADRAIYLLQWYLDGASEHSLVMVNQ